jgi:hypothetical protein
MSKNKWETIGGGNACWLTEGITDNIDLYLWDLDRPFPHVWHDQIGTVLQLQNWEAAT